MVLIGPLVGNTSVIADGGSPMMTLRLLLFGSSEAICCDCLDGYVSRIILPSDLNSWTIGSATEGLESGSTSTVGVCTA